MSINDIEHSLVSKEGQYMFQIFQKVGVNFSNLTSLNCMALKKLNYFAIFLRSDFPQIFNAFRIRVFFFFLGNSI